MTDQNNRPSSSLYFELHEHPLVGKYKRRKQGGWSADMTVYGLDYPATVNAPGAEPVKAQIDRFAELIARLPGIIASSNLPDAPTEEWRKRHPDYQLLNAPVSCLNLHEDGSFFVSLDAYLEDDWVPIFEISADFIVTEAIWGV